MFGFISEVALLNVQSYKEALFVFDGPRIHRITAKGTSNSYGKSVMRKALIAVFTPMGKDLDGRKTLIRYEHSDCYIMVKSTTGLLVTLYLNLEEKYCYYELEYGGEVIRKYLRDDYTIILDILGFHFLKEESYSLNFYKTKSALPFTHFSSRLNYKVRESASELPHYQSIIGDVEEQMSKMQKELRVLENLSSSFQFHINSLENTDLDSLYIESKLLENWLKYVEPLENVSIPVKDLAVAKTEIALVTYIDADFVSSHTRQLSSLSEAIKHLSGAVDSNTELDSLSYIDTVQAEHITNQLILMKDTIDSLTDIEQSLSKLSSIETISVDTLGTVLNQISIMSESHKDLEYLVKLLNSKPTGEGLIDLNKELTVIQSLSTVGGMLQEMHKSMVTFDAMDYVNVNDVSVHLDSIPHLNSLTSTLDSTIEVLGSYVELKSTIDMLSNEILNLESQLDICPSCGQLIIEEGHIHDEAI